MPRPKRVCGVGEDLGGGGGDIIVGFAEDVYVHLALEGCANFWGFVLES
jgi:hypothetical protein